MRAIDPDIIGPELRTGRREMLGEAMEFRASDGHEYAFIAASTGVLYVPHTAYLYCEFVFETDPALPPRLLSVRRFYFGDSGFIGSLTWPKLLGMTAGVLVVATAWIAAVVQLVKWLWQRRNLRARGFAVEPTKV